MYGPKYVTGSLIPKITREKGAQKQYVSLIY